MITGLGAVTHRGTDPAVLWAALASPGHEPIPTDPVGFDPRRWMSSKEVRRSALFTQLAVAASDLAWQSVSPEPDRTGSDGGVVFSVAYGAPEALDAARQVMELTGPLDVPPLLGATACENAPPAAASLRLGLKGPSKAIVGACAGGSMAIADAAELIRSGRCGIVLAGGTQAPMPASLMAAYRNLRVLSPDQRALPFDLRRRGFTFASGAGAMVLESLDHARERGARPLATLLGSASNNDAADIARPSGEGAVSCMRQALDDARVDPTDIVAINAHGTGTHLNDIVEARAIAEVFGTPGPPVTSSKGVLGHTSAAAGVLEAIAVVLGFAHGVVPPTAIDAEPDPALPIDVVWDRPRPVAPGPVLSTSFGLGGVNCSLVLAPPR